MPWPPPQLALSKLCSRSRLAVSEKSDFCRSSSVLFNVARSLELSAWGVIAPEWQESVTSTFHLPLMREPMSLPSVSMG